MNVVLHLGFPKTGSSTLQFGPFLALDKDDALCLRTWRKNDTKEDLGDRPSSCLFKGRMIDASYLNFCRTATNILSDESFTAPIRLRKLNFGNDINDPFLFPEKIIKQIKNAYPDSILNISCLVIIREQSSLIASQYVEEFNWKRYKNIDLLFDEHGFPDLSGYEIYNFASYLEKMEMLLGRENCNFLLFEDLVFDSLEFSRQLGEIFDTSPGFFHSSLKNSHANIKKKSPYGSFAKDGEHFVPYLREDVLQFIRSHYCENNKKLVSFFPKDKLQKYRYIDA